VKLASRGAQPVLLDTTNSGSGFRFTSIWNGIVVSHPGSSIMSVISFVPGVFQITVGVFELLFGGCPSENVHE